jgi:nicotinamide-nucleotide amidase
LIGERRTAAIVAVGDELLAGRCVDQNSGEIARALLDIGIEPQCFLVLGDDRAELQRTFGELCSNHGVVVVTGGLGPTLDDVTREAAAAAARVPLERSETVFDQLRAGYASRGRAMAESNERQAMFPIGAQVMPNRCGTAPGFRVWIECGTLAALPGPPHEMRDMLARELVPWLESTCGTTGGLLFRHFHLAGVSESDFADRVGAWMDRGANPRMSVTSKTGALQVVLSAEAQSAKGAQALMEPRAAEFRERFSEEIYSEDDPSLAAVVGRTLIERGLTLATAESCTGGLVAQLLTDVPGISAVFLEGLVTYTNAAKTRRLGVPEEVLARHGAVSAETVAAMAAGVVRESGARAGIAVSGVAGPGGGTEEKPVGLVWFGLSLEGQVSTREVRFPPVDRTSIRLFAAHTALDLLRRGLRDPITD